MFVPVLRAGVARPVRAATATTVDAGRGVLAAGHGVPVVMLHASLGSKAQWASLASTLAPRFRAIAVDLLGYGDLPVADPDLPGDVGGDVRALDERLAGLVGRRSRLHLVGHSYGGWLALRYAALHPERVASLALYEPVAFRALREDDPSLAELLRVAQRLPGLVRDGHRHLASQMFVDFWGGEGAFAALPLPARAAIARRIGKVPLDFRAALGWPDGPAAWRAIEAPVLLLAGRRSPAVARRIAAALLHALPDARTAWLDAGHMGPVTHAATVEALVAAFVDECEGERLRTRAA